MNLIAKINQIKRMDRLIRMKGTGRPDQLAYRLEISVRSVYDLINTMKTLGAPIQYCHFRGSYIYENEVNFSFGFIEPKAQVRSYGGLKNYLTNSFDVLQNFCTNNTEIYSVRIAGRSRISQASNM